MLAGAKEMKAEALAMIGGRPAAMKAGKTRNPDPPASALMQPARTPTAKRSAPEVSVIGHDCHLRGGAGPEQIRNLLLVVMAGLDPAICCQLRSDHRVKPGDDGSRVLSPE